MATQDWAVRLEKGDFPGARSAWAGRFAANLKSLDASGALAEVEERWGDSLFFSGQPGAAQHYHAALQALVPPGIQFSSAEENDRRMAAHGRVVQKLYALDGSGRARTVQCVDPHPNAGPPQPQPDQGPKPKQQTDFGRLFAGSGHWGFHDLGNRWQVAGTALATSHPAHALAAFDWSLHYFELYNRDWSAHLPASRWDSDGGQEMEEVQAAMSALHTGAPAEPIAPWAEHLLAGEWRHARSALGSGPQPAELEPLAVLLAQACRLGGE